MGPLAGLRVVELAGIGPLPFCGMLLSDLGADVTIVERPGSHQAGLDVDRQLNVALRGRRSVTVDLSRPAGRDVVLRLVETADVLVEGFRPGVTERLGLGPDICRTRNPRLVYGRITGYGQDGPMAQAAGHDINYLALAGVLSAIGTAERPVPPLNLVADYGGGALYLVMGILAALFERQRSGLGQTVDAAMIDGAASMIGPIAALIGAGGWSTQRGANVLDGGAPYYDVYETRDGRHVSVSAIEDRFFEVLREQLGLDPIWRRQRTDPARWSELRSLMAAAFLTRSRDEWCLHMEGHDACFAPVLTTVEAALHPHMRARGQLAEVGGVVHAAPAPRFGRTPLDHPRPIGVIGADRNAILAEAGFSPAEVADMIEGNIVG